MHDHLGKDTHHMVPTREAGKTVKRRACLNGIMGLTGETDMPSVVKQQFDLQGKKCMKVRVRHKEMSDPDAFEAFKSSDMLKGYF